MPLDGAEQPAGEVGDGNADPHRFLTGGTGGRHQAAHAFGDLIEARPLVVEGHFENFRPVGEGDKKLQNNPMQVPKRPI
jgi:hypothetical protein